MINLQTLTWLPLTIYTLAAVPQLLKSFRARSAVGVSQAMIFIRATAVLFYLVYAYGCNLPLSYRVLMPLYWALLMGLCAMGYWYDASQRERYKMLVGYSTAWALVGALQCATYFDAFTVGSIAGWCAIICYSLCEIPQVYKNYRRKSVQGFSFLFASMLALGASMEMMMVFLFGLPAPTLASAIRLLTFYAIYCVQFTLYRVNKQPL